MYKRILVVSDNVFLAREVKKIIDSGKRKHKFTFAISPFSDKEDFEIALNSSVEVLNLKDEDIINDIITRFDLVFSIHCKQLFPKMLVNNLKCINVHPGYNPLNRGWYPQVFAIIENTPIGATIHEIDALLDHGNIIARDFVPTHAWDTSKDVYERVVAKEVELLRTYLWDIIAGSYEVTKPESEGKLKLKKDFNQLLEINLEETATYGEVINRLRALTHGNFKNAYFIDPVSNRKIYLSISLIKEEDK